MQVLLIPKIEYCIHSVGIIQPPPQIVNISRLIFRNELGRRRKKEGEWLYGRGIELIFIDPRAVAQTLAASRHFILNWSKLSGHVQYIDR